MIVFIHVPKTAGTHFRRYLESVYRPEEVVWDYRDDPAPALARCYTDPVGWRRNTRRFAQQLPVTTKIIFGNFTATKYLDLFPSTQWMTWVRHPVNRLISNYYFLKSLTDAEIPSEPHSLLEAVQSGISFAEYCEIPVMQNIMTQLFFRVLDPEDFAFIGVHEHFAEDLETLRQQLGWPGTPIIAERTNTNRYPAYAENVDAILADRGLIRRIERMNRADLAFYARAVGLRSRRVRPRIAECPLILR
jgi:Sulfotransferase family